MHSLEEKEYVIKLMKKRTNINKIILETGISRSTALKWKKELKLRQYIRRLIESGNFEEAKREVEKIKGKANELVRNSILIRIAREEGDRAAEKKLLDRRIELKPDDAKAINSRMRIAREEGDIKTQKRLLDIILEQEPENVKIIISRIRIAKKEKDKKLQYELIRRLAGAKLTEDTELKDFLLQQYASQQQQETDLKEKNTSTIKKARELIYGCSDIMQASEQIKELLERQNELEREIALAELFIKTGLQARAEKSLKAYKRKIEDLPEKQEELRIVKKALELVRNTKAKKFQWDELWKTLESSQAATRAKEEPDER